jgi:hypothetical protein
VSSQHKQNLHPESKSIYDEFMHSAQTNINDTFQLTNHLCAQKNWNEKQYCQVIFFFF